MLYLADINVIGRFGGQDMEDDEKFKVERSRSNQKLKILYLLKILMEKTDETHSITLNEIIVHL